ncbi:zinc ribbon domain-containing protein YjdM [Vagococcus lutrae]|uniref:zinc ribbon domain-containing protein YjdM n=1 Tax=Vagococcus lutrae TaxID=81947 RepID=UPI001443ECF8|nr:zinc ribbon domain-containing protein YjdM [Vagococcus lutrae]NKZ28045.1 alkylphosphonate utilization protein [Vagococcus lutrae]
MSLPNCPQCQSTYVYEDRDLYICPECAHEWSEGEEETLESTVIIKDANGNPLADGDSVTIVKDLKVKGSSQALKKGTTIKNIRLLEEAVNGHNVDCKVPGFGAMQLKSEFLKKI